MVKFGKYLLSEAVPEWKDKYINYKKLKKILKKITRTLDAAKGRTPEDSKLDEPPTPQNAATTPLGGAAAADGTGSPTGATAGTNFNLFANDEIAKKHFKPAALTPIVEIGAFSDAVPPIAPGNAAALIAAATQPPPPPADTHHHTDDSSSDEHKHAGEASLSSAVSSVVPHAVIAPTGRVPPPKLTALSRAARHRTAPVSGFGVSPTLFAPPEPANGVVSPTTHAVDSDTLRSALHSDIDLAQLFPNAPTATATTTTAAAAPPFAVAMAVVPAPSANASRPFVPPISTMLITDAADDDPDGASGLYSPHAPMGLNRALSSAVDSPRHHASHADDSALPGAAVALDRPAARSVKPNGDAVPSVSIAVAPSATGAGSGAAAAGTEAGTSRRIPAVSPRRAFAFNNTPTATTTATAAAAPSASGGSAANAAASEEKTVSPASPLKLRPSRAKTVYNLHAAGLKENGTAPAANGHDNAAAPTVARVPLVARDSFELLVPQTILAAGPEREFFAMLQSELESIEEFYLKEEAFFETQYTVLIKQLLLSTPAAVAAAAAAAGGGRPATSAGADPLSATRSAAQSVSSGSSGSNGASPAASAVPGANVPPPAKPVKLGMSSQDQNELKKACEEVYRGLHLLKNYRILNYTGFVKITKKHDKVADYKRSSELVLPIVANSPFCTSTKLHNLISDIEQTYVQFFAGGDRKGAMERLRGRNLALSQWITFSVGLSVGVCICIMLALGLVWNFSDAFSQSTYFISAFPIFRCTAMITLHIWLYGIGMYFMDYYRINYGFILEVDPDTRLNFAQVFEFAAGLSLFLFLSLSLLCLSVASRVLPPEVFQFQAPPGAIHLAWFIAYVMIFACPFDLFFRPTRWFFFRSIGRIICSGFYQVTFLDFFLADQLCSQVKVLFDITYGLCLYGTGAFLDPTATGLCNAVANNGMWVLASLPYIWRFLQCCRRWRDTGTAYPHMVNGAKYMCSVCVTLLNLLQAKFGSGYREAWITMAIISTLFSFGWDIRMDWGLVQFETGSKHPLLRRNRVVDESPWVYYVAMFLNLCFRVLWIITISPTLLGTGLSNSFASMGLAALEVCRRNMWNFFRFENEHLNNCGQYRAVRAVPTVGFASNYPVFKASQPIFVKPKSGTEPAAAPAAASSPPSDKSNGAFVIPPFRGVASAANGSSNGAVQRPNGAATTLNGRAAIHT